MRLIRQSKRPVILGLICGVFLGAASVALAAEAYGTVGGTYVIDGHTYYNRSDILTQQGGSPSDWAYTVTWTQNNSTVGAGWIAVDARKFKNGSLCEQTGYQYNSSPVTGLGLYANSVACGSGTYYSYGLTAYWNGNGYDYYDTFRSPSLNG